jgi:pilus assembly protein FimV
MEYSPTVSQLRVQLHRRPDGRTVLRLSSDRPVNEPFIDLVIDATWSAGHMTRNYTMLFDPPAARRAPVAVTAPPQIAAPKAAARTAAAASSTESLGTAPAPARAPITARAAPAPKPAPSEGVAVKSGDTAGRIASAHRPAGVSLDQMLVAMVHANPDAFVQGNVHRLKAGAILQIPDEAQANATPVAQARQMLSVQSRDFNEFRRKLAGVAPAAAVEASSRSASGSIQTQVEEKKPASTAPDKLTLSKGTVQGQSATEDLLAKRKQASEAAARVEELSKNITELNKLNAAPASTPAPAPASPEVAAVAPTPAPAPPAAAPEAASATAAASTDATANPAAPAASETAAPASAVVAEPAQPPAITASVAAAKPTPAPAAAEEPGFLSSLLDDPMVPLAGGGLLALLTGYGAYSVFQRRRKGAGAAAGNSFLESHLQPDSFFGASGGQRVDTTDSEAGSSIAYSHSQLDTGGDVDPIAEADVYLAYGRDLQAEEILKEALRQNPARIAVHAKLAEIYAKRQDRKALEVVALDVHRATQGEGAEWKRIVEIGRELDPQNSLYQASGAGALAAAPTEADSAVPTEDFVNTLADQATSEQLPPDLDLDLELDQPDETLADAPAAAPGAFAAVAAANGAYSSSGALESTAKPASQPFPSLPDFDALATQPAESAPMPADTAPTIAPPPMAEIDFPMETPAREAEPKPEESAPPADVGMLEFDLGDLSLDLDTSFTPSTPAAAAPAANTPDMTEALEMHAQDASELSPLADDQLDTKLALAQEFNTIGDSDGARTLIEEVIAESSGALKARAQRMLSELG